MRRLPFASLFVLAAIAGAAEPVPPAVTASRPADESSQASATASSSAVKPRRLLSPDTAAKLAAAGPKFVTPSGGSSPGAPAEISPVARETGKPRNQIIRLPRYIVEEPKLHIPKGELQVLTWKGRIEYAFDRRPGLRFGPFAWLNRTIALEMLEDDLLAQRRKEEADLWSLYLIRDVVPAGGDPLAPRTK